MIDEVQITVKAGDGGAGHVSFRREKFVEKGGPDGGDGGNGGSIYLVADPNINTLLFFSDKRLIRGKNGESGGKAKKHGKNSEDIIFKVPLGTLVYNRNAEKEIVDLSIPLTKYCLARGGLGGRGNWHFRSATNQTPRFAEKGTKGEEKNILLKLKVLANIGLTGLPNAGKSTLLSMLTNAKPKIANYPFTTLSPNIGVMEIENHDGLVIADLPGLIEGASQGKGLGTQFLKHIERCQLLVYVLFPEVYMLEFPELIIAKELWNQMQKIKNELQQFNPNLLTLESITIVNKKDILTKTQEIAITTYFKKQKQTILFVSAATGENIQTFREKLHESYKLLRCRPTLLK